MQKPLALTLALCLGLAGCQIFEKSETWETVMRVRPGDTIHEPDDSATYAEKLHRVLLEQGVEHIVVTYQFHYYTNHYEEALTTRTAVIYRDDINPHYPWWLKDDRIATPFWLPNGDLNHQVSFYCLRPAEVIEKHVYPAHGSGKETVSLVRPPQSHHRAESLQKPQPLTRVTQVKAVPASPAKSAVSVHPATIKPVAEATHPTAVTKIQQSAPKIAAHPAPSPAPSPSTSSLSPSAAIDPIAQGTNLEGRDEHLEKIFRARNGTKYDPTSAVDRRKMEKIQHASLERETLGANGFRGGVDNPFR